MVPPSAVRPSRTLHAGARVNPAGPVRVWPAIRVHERFETLADRQPEAPAIISDHGTLTYGDLDRKANALAHALLAQGVAAEEAVGVLAERSASLPLAFLAILKTGGAYVPMGADLPPQRLANMAVQSGMRRLISLDGLEPPAELLAALGANSVETSPAVFRPEELTGDDLARHGHRPNQPGKTTDLVAILFTSGSTGQPKGVLLQHDACINMAYGHISAQGVTPNDRLLLAAAPGFILGFREVCLPLLAGAAFVPVSRALLDDPAALLAAMSRHRVTVAMFTPSYLHLFHGAVPLGLRCILTAGERPNADDARAYAAKLDYWNIQGATEVCGTICMSRVDPNGRGPLPSGRPFPNLGVYLLNGSGKEVPPGEAGEIYVVGVGVARGYLNQPDLTAARFVETPYGRAYRSSDLGRWNEDGQLESLGRVDDMVKVSGQAVSLGEIEQTLLRHEAVKYAAALQHEGKLIAFVEIQRPDRASVEDWRGFLTKTLPAYMLPAEVTTVPKIPRNTYGKVDRQALIALAVQTSGLRPDGDRGAPPQGEVERRIAEVWEERLGVRPIMREDNFFALGGTSLRSIEISQRLHTMGYPVTAQAILVSTTVAALAAKVALALEQQPATPAPDVSEDSATAGQEDFWIAWKLGLGTIGAQITRVLAVRGTVPEPARWQEAWAQLVARHAALRTAFFVNADNEVRWRTADAEQLTPAAQFSIDRCDSPDQAQERIAARSNLPFLLTEPALARAGLVQVSEGGGETLFWFTLHHAVVDGLSARIVQEEMHLLLLGRALPPAPNGIAQAAWAERHYLASGLAERDRAWWRDKLDALTAEAGGAAFHEFATDRRRPASPSGTAAAPLVERLDAVTVAALARLAQAQHAGMHALLLTLLAAEARRRDGRQNLIVGTGVSVRPPGADRSVGYFVNLLPLALAAGSAQSLAGQMRATQTTLTEAIEHGDYPAGLLYREFRQRHPHARPHSRTSLFDISLTTNPARTSGDANTDFSLTPRNLPGELTHPAAGIDLAFSHEPVEDNGGGLELELVWNPDVYRRDTAQAWLSSLAAWARWLAEDIGRANAPLPALLPEEARSLAQWERGPSRTRPAKRFDELFEDLVDSHPERAAVIADTGVQSYAELEHRANRIAWALIGHGVAREEPVAVLTDCSASLPAAVLGIWKAGAAYLPLALEQPPERLAYMVRDAGARTLIVLDGHVVPPPLAQSVRTILGPEDWDQATPAERPTVAGAPQDLAYIVYTSGTTGMPKGVLIQHDSLVNAAYASGEMFGLTPEDRFSLVATPGFDASLWELGAALLHGMALVPVSQALRDDPWALKRWYKTYGVTVAFHAPSYLRVSKQTPFEGMRVLICGGEAPNHDDVRHHANHLAFWNACGPTETTIYVCAEQMSPDPDPDRPLSLGRPCPNTRISIRRDNGVPVPPGVVAEVWIGGTGLARGYLNNPELTDERFVETPEGRFYRSGDLGRWTTDGRLELAGRIDHQVKLHGQRLELGEVEQALRSHPAFEEAVTLVEAAANDTKILRAFVRLRPAAVMPARDQWTEYLGARLPPYMVPASVTSVAAIPLTINGKIDRDALLLLPTQTDDEAAKTPPAGELEMRIAAVWGDLLGAIVSREDNFFALGGNSLLAVTLAHRLSHELAQPVPARELFAAPTLAGFAQRVAELPPAAAPAHDGRGPAAVKSDLATEGQREFRVAEAAGLDTRTFTIPVMRRIEGEMPPLARWNKAWSKLVTRHEALRSYFYEDEEDRLRRASVPALMPTLETATQPDLPAARAFIRQRQAEPFIMGAIPLWRAGLVKVTDSGEHLFWLALHHSVGDGQSIGIILEELGALLRGENLPPLAGSFGESARLEEDYLAGPACASDGRHWRDLLARQPESAFEEGPLDFPRSIAATTGTHRFETRLNAATVRELNALARQHEASLHAVILTLLALEARRRIGRGDVMVGTTASIRETAAEAQVVGYYVNMLPVPFHLPRRVAFGAALRETQQALAAGLQRARYPFARMYRDFWSEHPQQRHPARYPLFDMAVTENPASPPAPASLRLTRVLALAETNAETIAYELTDGSPGLDMVLIHEGLADGGLLLLWHVNAALYKLETARYWIEALQGWAMWLAEDTRRARETLPELLPREAALLESWEDGAKIARPALRFHELFERVLDTPNQCDRPAVVTAAGITTYAALEREANAIAHRLLLGGAAPGIVVGVLTGRSANLPAAVLGIWKAGATYLPLAADLPAERLVFIARDAGVSLLIALDGLAAPPGLPAPFRPEEMDAEFRRTHTHRPRRSGSPTDAAYIIYTSGSTGRPKGTLIGHDAYVNSVLGAGETIGLTHHDRSLMFASPSFDVSLSDLGLPLAFGAALCPVPYDILSSPNRFRTFLTELGITVADVTPTYLRLFEGAELPSLRILVTGGEAPFPADVETYAGHHQYFNAYGPTENTITSTIGRLRPSGQGVLSGGRPLPNTNVYVCDPLGNPVPPGVVGELWLGGAGLAQGYVGQPDLTAAAFVETSGGRRYRSGDLGRWRSTGEIEILGRVDDQVKLNGIRVELGEIEHALGSHPDIAQAVALLDSTAEGGHSLWAFVRPLPGKPAPAEESWRPYLAGRLPAYMIPSTVIAIADIPLSHSGKVDKASLKRLRAGRSRQGEEAPADSLESEIAALWSQLLDHGPIHRDDNFFSLGGHSLLAIAMANRLEQTLGHPVPARELFAEPTLRGFAHRVAQLGKADRPIPILSDRATEGQREFWVAEHAGLDTRSFIMSLTLVAHEPVSRWRSAWAAMVARHDALRTAFHQDAKGVLRRTVLPELGADLEISSHPDIPTALAHIRQRHMEPFRMESPPLWRAGLVQAGDQRFFFLALHHSVGDGVSLGVLAEELSTVLRGERLPPVASPFDHSAGQEEVYLAEPTCREDAAYWRNALAAHSSDDWPLDFPRPLGRTTQRAKGSHSFRVRLDAATGAGLRGFAQRNGVSLHTLMLTIMAQEVRRRTGRSEFLLGTAVSTRDSVNEARTVGYYVNLLPLPCRVDPRNSVEQALRTMHRALAEGLQHARYPFARMYGDFRQDHAPAPHPARYPLFDLAVMENPGSLDSAIDSLASPDRSELRLSGPPQDMVLVHEGQPDGSLILQWYVNAAIYEKETAQDWIDSLSGWARFLAAGKRLPDSPLPALLPEEADLLAGWEQGPALPHPAPSFPARFEYWAHVQPERPALVTEQGAQSYGVLNARSNALAHALRARGVALQEPVGVLTDRSVSLPEIVLAIWKAGACYLPLVKDLPADRLAFIARDAGIRLLVVLDGLEPPAALIETGCQVFRPESLPDAFLSSHGHPLEIGGDGVGGSELAYIIYTSGSTGVPKGVVLRHQGLNNLGVGTVAALDTRADDRVALLASPAFDAWIADLAMAWAVGAAVVPVLRGEMDDISGIRDKFVRLGVTAATMAPSYLRLFEQADFPGLRLLITAGEPPHRADALHYATSLRYFNGYGPTESTVAAGYGRVTAQTERLTAGKPLANTSVHIRNHEGEPVPPGATGLIWLGGMGLALGYLNRPGLTAASFVETSAGRLYDTGDLGRWTHSGELEILGRSDDQVKLRGQRVELGEIEHRLGTHPGVLQGVAAVETGTEGTQTLWAFVALLPAAAEPTQAEWHGYLSVALPSYMLPAAVFHVPAIPVTPAGKVDREALLRVASERGANTAVDGGGRQGTPPRGGTEASIARVWAEHLECPPIAREDNFFDLGGNSLRAISVVNQLRRNFQCNINDLYEHPQLADFAATCRPRPEHLRTLVQSAARHWQAYRHGLTAYEAERDAALAVAQRDYEKRNQAYRRDDAGTRRDYGRVLLTGASGYLGSYLLRELLAGPDRQVSVLVRGADNPAARTRLGEVLSHYFGPDEGAALLDDPRLTVLAGDLRRDDLGLSIRDHDRLAESAQAIFHCAANVKHFGHYWEFQADNVSATGRLLKLAAHRAANPADFHLVSTLSVCGQAPESSFRLFTEYDAVPEELDENYYIRSKQEAERLVVAARRSLANASIHRVGNLVFAAAGGPLQLNIEENAFFRQLAAFLRLGVVPDDSHLWLCHVDLVARGLVLLAGAADLANETHHLENARRDTLASFVSAAEGVRARGFDGLLDRLEAAVDEPEMDAALTETLENFGLYRGVSPQERARRLEIVSERTQILLARWGFLWPPVPAAGQAEMLRRAARLFSGPSLSNAAGGGPR